MEIECCLGVALLAKLALEICSVLSNNLKIVVLQSFADFKVSVKTLTSHFLVRILNKVY